MPDTSSPKALSADEREWLATRARLTDERFELGVQAAELYPGLLKVEGTPLLSRSEWLPEKPLPLDAVKLMSVPDAPPLPRLPLDTPTVVPHGYSSYVDALLALTPARLENRSTYRLRAADLRRPAAWMSFSRGRYSDGLDTGEAAAHEYASGRSAVLREAIGDPCDPARRPTNIAISTLTIREDRSTGEATFILHWRDPAKVGHAGGLFQVAPAGIFQASGEADWNDMNDFSLWRCMTQEFAEELLGRPEEYGSELAPIDYASWPFAVAMNAAVTSGAASAYCLGLGVDPLTFATDLLTVVVFDGLVFDELFGTLVDENAEGLLLRGDDGNVGIAFTRENVERYARRERMQAAGAALLALAWRHRESLLAR
ncbi:hypothetical protein Afil01_15170 [Actinorhabdospora filicis]|uniref:Uncharacterized protein n=1 Tax=Actinorhabdospora filicis TaxID=1785913 RepID=A0A9W6SIR3_9ACTN|nr:hypothetical protein [Actinorhabdospora filicis]GLZ76710.1 hypothetical protein Afil01_15170 [Actinorhabdospora filicis]